jgi:hypothetical protein
MRAGGIIGDLGRRLLCAAVGIMQAEFERRGVLGGIPSQRKSTERDKQSLHCDGVCNNKSN